MKKWLKEKGDEFNYIPTVDAVMQAYRNKMLDWNLGLVTYWLDGRQICEPRLHDLGVLSILTEDPRYKKGVWVEGVSEA